MRCPPINPIIVGSAISAVTWAVLGIGTLGFFWYVYWLCLFLALFSIGVLVVECRGRSGNPRAALALGIVLCAMTVLMTRGLTSWSTFGLAIAISAGLLVVGAAKRFGPADPPTFG